MHLPLYLKENTHHSRGLVNFELILVIVQFIIVGQHWSWLIALLLTLNKDCLIVEMLRGRIVGLAQAGAL